MATTRRYYGLAHVRWELPFLLRIEQRPIFIWDRQEGVALFVPLSRLGSIQWRRTFPLLTAEQMFGDGFVSEPDEGLPNRDYRNKAVVNGKGFYATQIHGGKDGGFTEAQAYTVANVFLCLRKAEEFDGTALRDRAADALNNVLAVHSMLAVDGLTRLIRPELDSYYTVVSFGRVPDDWPQLTAEELLDKFQELPFALEVGHGRTHNIGIGSHRDFTIAPFEPPKMNLAQALVRQQVEIAPYQTLLLSAIRRLSRRETFLAVIDAESAVEVCVSNLLRRVMLADGITDAQIDTEMDGRLNRPQPQMVHLDKFATKKGVEKRFDPSDAAKKWRSNLADLRHKIVHRGLRTVSFDEARAAVSAGIAAVNYLEEMFPEHAPTIRWEAALADLIWIEDLPNKLFRLFDA